MIHGIAVNADYERIDGNFAVLEQFMARLQRLGFDGVELSVPSLNFIRGGQIIAAEVARAQELLGAYDFHITLHCPNELNLLRGPAHLAVMDSVLALASALQAKRIVYHSAQIALQNSHHPLAPLPSDEELAGMVERETKALTEYGRRAGDMGLAIAVENRDPHLWEIASLGVHGKRASELVHYHQGMRLDFLVRQMEAISLPNVGLCLDVGHAFLAAPYWPHSDYLSAIRACAPWVNHLHFHDNFGRIDDLAQSISERLVFGEADNHLPPGWGQIPLREVLSLLLATGYDGYLVLEIRPRYQEYLDEALSSTRALLAEAANNGGGA